MTEAEKKEIISKNLNNVLQGSDLKGLGNRLVGKVRDVYDLGESMAFITTDRQSAFDRVLGFVPFKGQVLSETSNFWFEQTKDIVPNHIQAIPDPNIVIGKKCSIFPVEFVMRGYLTGVTSTAVWTAYEKGEREFCGNTLPEGMVKNQAFDEPIITPTTKSDEHDEKITPKEIVEQGLISQEEWNACKDIAIKLFQRGSEIANKNGLILVDTKYEMGKDSDGNIVLCDEIHTPDSSRYWLSSSFEQRLKDNQEPENIDKEFLRLWFKENSDPYKDKVLPEAPRELVIELSSRYIRLYEMITGKEFVFNEENIEKRMEENLKRTGFLS